MTAYMDECSFVKFPQSAKPWKLKTIRKKSKFRQALKNLVPSELGNLNKHYFYEMNNTVCLSPVIAQISVKRELFRKMSPSSKMSLVVHVKCLDVS